ncbi:GNAT family N-acetyltransferase [Alcaligenes sp. CHO6]|uniref:GNAT family N-acetyltransferase n=1 Tax=Alcaligenes sp. CHO6 TaxID=3123298 RepID=UPI00301536B7
MLATRAQTMTLRSHANPIDMEVKMALDFQWKRLDDISSRELYALIQVREAVFVVEQQCAYQEVDGLDLTAWHLSVFKDGELAAYARVVEPGLKYAEPSIGRVLTVAKFRSLKIGYALVAEAIRFTHAQYPGEDIRIGAQAHLQKFYGSLGFEPVGEIYDEDGIAHIDMVKPATPVDGSMDAHQDHPARRLGL